jgi:3-hydroxybutyrate dehydrogenase
MNIACVHGLFGPRDTAPRVGAKHGLVGLCRVAALEYTVAGGRARRGLIVDCICPGRTDTAITAPQIEARAEAHGGDRDAGIAALLSGKRPARRVSARAEIGALAPWRRVSLAHNVPGTAIRVDGGWMARRRAARSAAMPPGHSPPIARPPPCSAASGTLHRPA